MVKRFLLPFALVSVCTRFVLNKKNELRIIAYYFAGPEKVKTIKAEKLTHNIFSFRYLKGNRLTVDSQIDGKGISAALRNPKQFQGVLIDR
jgi:hypothetical protein